MSTDAHRTAAAETPVRAAVVTVSDTRTEASDASGRLAREQLQTVAEVVDYRLLPDDGARLRAHLEALAFQADVVLTSGGTGLASRDATVQAAEALIEKPMPGFGELFRMLSWQEIGAAAMLSRATAGIYALEQGGVLLFCLPGSTAAVRLGLEKLILPELRHLVWELRRQRAA